MEKVVVPANLINPLVKYLEARPYAEVAQFLQALAQCEVIKPEAPVGELKDAAKKG